MFGLMLDFHELVGPVGLHATRYGALALQLLQAGSKTFLFGC